MRVYQTREDGVFIGYVEADESPLEPGVFLIPRGCIIEEPPTFGEPNQARWDFDNEEWIIEPIPEEPPPEEGENIPVEPTKIVKTDIWRRATEVEAEGMSLALAAAPVRLREMYNAATYISINDPEFDALRAGIAAVVGEERAAIILKPTEV